MTTRIDNQHSCHDVWPPFGGRGDSIASIAHHYFRALRAIGGIVEDCCSAMSAPAVRELVSILATFIADMITGVIPPPGCTQWPTK